MLNHPARGPNRGSTLTGRSVHNQRTEHLWLEVKKIIVSYYHNLFYFLEQNLFLDPLDECHLFSLHYIHVPHLSKELNEMSGSRNYHPLNTQGNRSPRHLWHFGLHASENSDYLAVESVFDEQQMNEFGTSGGPPVDYNTDNDVQIPEVSLSLSEQEQ